MRKAPDDAALAWELAATARPHLSRVEADRIYITLGIGETFTAIDALITAIARNHIALSDDLVAATASWLDCYLGQGDEPRLRHLLGAIIAAASQQRCPPPTSEPILGWATPPTQRDLDGFHALRRRLDQPDVNVRRRLPRSPAPRYGRVSGNRS